MRRESHLPKHEGLLQLHMRSWFRWRRPSVRGRQSVQTERENQADRNDRGRIRRGCSVYHCFDFVLLLYEKEEEEGESGRTKNFKNGLLHAGLVLHVEWRRQGLRVTVQRCNHLNWSRCVTHSQCDLTTYRKALVLWSHMGFEPTTFHSAVCWS